MLDYLLIVQRLFPVPFSDDIVVLVRLGNDVIAEPLYLEQHQLVELALPHPMRCAVGFAYDVCSTNDATLDTFSYAIERGIEVVIPDNTLKNRNMTLYQERHTRKAVVS